MTANRIYHVFVVGVGNAALCAVISAKENSANILVPEKDILTDLPETESDQIVLSPERW
jgi:succinate dehydrogenase/fumarate reductase flavoprotein subunit